MSDNSVAIAVLITTLLGVFIIGYAAYSFGGIIALVTLVTIAVITIWKWGGI
jgi:hypothetical protein